MKGIFSGLEKLGLGKLEKVEVFEDASKKEEEAKEGKTQKNQEIIPRIIFFGCTPLIRFTVRPS